MKLIKWTIFFAFIAMLQPSCSIDEEMPEEGQPSISEDEFKVAKLQISTDNWKSVSSKEAYVPCAIHIDSDVAGWDFSGRASIRGRGNSTWHWYDKKPYRIKLDEKAGILGLAEDKDWVLLADYRDPTHMMNTFVLVMGKGLGLPFTNHSRYVEVTLNNEYIGLYLLTEQVEQGSNRVNIDETDGLLLSLDADDGPDLNPGAEDNFWSGTYRMPMVVKSPDIISVGQLATIKSEFSKLESAIKQGNYAEVDQILDIRSFIDFMLIQELVYNVEVAAPRSMNIHKDKDGKWTMGPLWDFDGGFDFDWSTMLTGHNYFYSYKELVLGTSPAQQIGGYKVPAFFTDLFKSRQFVDQYQKRWLEVRDNIINEYWVTSKKYADGFADAMKRDAIRWPINKDHKTEVARLKIWLQNRISYLNQVIANYPEGTK